MKKLSIDAVKLVRQIRDKNYAETKNLSSEEKLEYYKKKVSKINTKRILPLNK